MKKFLVVLLAFFSFNVFAADFTVKTVDRKNFTLVAIMQNLENGEKLGMSFICSKVDGQIYPTFIEPGSWNNGPVEIGGFRFISWDNAGKAELFVTFDSYGEGMFNLGQTLRAMTKPSIPNTYSIRLYDKDGKTTFTTSSIRPFVFAKMFKDAPACNTSDIAPKEDWRVAGDVDFASFEAMP